MTTPVRPVQATDPFATVGDVQHPHDPFAEIGDAGVRLRAVATPPTDGMTTEQKIAANPNLSDSERQRHLNLLHSNRAALAQLGNELDEENHPGITSRLADALYQTGKSIVTHPIDTLGQFVTAPITSAVDATVAPTVEGAKRYSADRVAQAQNVARFGEEIHPTGVTGEERAAAVAQTLANTVAPELGPVLGGAAVGASYSPDDPLVGAVVGSTVGKGLHEAGAAPEAARTAAGERFKPAIDQAFADYAKESKGTPPVSDDARADNDRIRTSNFATMLEQGAKEMPFRAKGAGAPPPTPPLSPEAQAVSDFEAQLRAGAAEKPPKKIEPLATQNPADVVADEAAQRAAPIEAAKDAEEARQEELTRQQALRALTGVRRRPQGAVPADAPVDAPAATPTGSLIDQMKASMAGGQPPVEPPARAAAPSLPGSDDAGAAANLSPFDTPAILDARAHSAATPETHTIDTPERQALRTQLTDTHYQNAVNAVPGGPAFDRQAIIVIGKAGSGKTSVAARPASEAYHAAIFDTDDVKKALPEYDSGRGSQVVYREAGQINKNARVRAIQQGMNIVYPTIAPDPAALESYSKALEDEGYTVHVRHVDTPTDVAAARAVSRYEAGDGSHYLDPAYILQQGENARRSYDALKRRPGVASYAEIDNGTNGQPGRVTAAHNALEFADAEQRLAGQDRAGVDGGGGGAAANAPSIARPVGPAAPAGPADAVVPSTTTEPAASGLESSPGSPSTPERLTAATIRLPDGRIFESRPGGAHFEAVDNLLAAGVPEELLEKAEEGFSTTKRRHVSRAEATHLIGMNPEAGLVDASYFDTDEYHNPTPPAEAPAPPSNPGPPANPAVTGGAELSRGSAASLIDRMKQAYPSYPEGFTMGDTEPRMPPVPQAGRKLSTIGTAPGQYLDRDTAAAFDRGTAPPETRTANAPTVDQTSLVAQLRKALDDATKAAPPDGEPTASGQRIKRAKKGEVLSDDPRYENGGRRPLHLVTVDGLVKELVDLEAKREDAVRRSVYRTVDHEDGTDTAFGTRQVATRGAGGISEQAKAFQNLEDYARIDAEVMHELQHGRGLPKDIIDELVNRRREVEEERAGQRANGRDDEGDTSFDFGDVGDVGDVGDGPHSFDALHANPELADHLATHDGPLDFQPESRTVRAGEPERPNPEDFQSPAERAALERARALLDGTNNELPPLPRGEPRSTARLLNERTFDQSPEIQRQVQAAELRMGMNGVTKERVPIAEGRARLKAMTRDALVEMGLDPTSMDLHKVGRLSGEEIVAFKQHATALMDQIAAISKHLDDPKLSDADRAQLNATLEKTTEERDRVLERVVRASSQKGRDLNFLRQIAHRSLDPDVWVVQAKRIAGDQPLSDSVIAEIRKLARDTAEACGQ